MWVLKWVSKDIFMFMEEVYKESFFVMLGEKKTTTPMPLTDSLSGEEPLYVPRIEVLSQDQPQMSWHTPSTFFSRNSATFVVIDLTSDQ